MENLTIPETILRPDMVKYLTDNGFEMRKGHEIEKFDYRFKKDNYLITLYGDQMKCEYKWKSNLSQTEGWKTVFDGYAPEFLRGFQELLMCIGFVRHQVFSIPENPEQQIAGYIKSCELNISIWDKFAKEHELTNALQYSLDMAKAETGRKFLTEFKRIFKL